MDSAPTRPPLSTSAAGTKPVTTAAVDVAVPSAPSVTASLAPPAVVAVAAPTVMMPPQPPPPPPPQTHHQQQQQVQLQLQSHPLHPADQYAHLWNSQSHSSHIHAHSRSQILEQQQSQQSQQQPLLQQQAPQPFAIPNSLSHQAPTPHSAALHPLHHAPISLSTQHPTHYFHHAVHPSHPAHGAHATHLIHAAPDHQHSHPLAAQHHSHAALAQHIAYTTHPHAHVPVAMPISHTTATTSALPVSTSADHHVVARLETELAAARREIDALRAKLVDVEKERAKTDNAKTQSRYWTPDEHKRFLEALSKYGPKDVRAIATFVGSRNATQVRTHAQKYFLRMARESRAPAMSLQAARKRSMSESDLARVGQSATTPPGSPVMGQPASVAHPQNHSVPPSFASNGMHHGGFVSHVSSAPQLTSQSYAASAENVGRGPSYLSPSAPHVSTIPAIMNCADASPDINIVDDGDTKMSVPISAGMHSESASHAVKNSDRGTEIGKVPASSDTMASFPRSTVLVSSNTLSYEMTPSSAAKPPPARNSLTSPPPPAAPTSSMAIAASRHEPSADSTGESDVVHMQLDSDASVPNTTGSHSPDKNLHSLTFSGSQPRLPSPARNRAARPPPVASARTPPRPLTSTIPDSSGINLLSIVASERKLAADKQATSHSIPSQKVQSQTLASHSLPPLKDQSNGNSGSS